MAENLVLRLIAQSDKFRRDIRSSKQSVENLTGSVNSAKSVMKGFAALTGTGIGLYQLNRGIRSSITEFAAFEKQMANVSTMLRGQNMKFLPGYTKTLSKMSVEFGEGTDTLSKGLYDILSASIPASKALNVLAVSAKAATAGVTTTAVSADAITSILNSYSMEADQASKVSSDLFETVQKGKITFQELSQDIGKVASLAATGGVSLEALLATVSTLTRAGLKSEMAMTGVKNIINSFVTKATPDAVEAARQLGISFDISSLAGDGLITIFKKLKNANMQQLGALMPNVRGLVALSAGIRQAGNAFEDLRYIQSTSGADLDAFSKINDTTAKAIDRMQQSWSLLKRQLGEDLSPAVRKLSEAFVELSKEDSGLRTTVKLLVQAVDLTSKLFGGAWGVGSYGADKVVAVAKAIQETTELGVASEDLKRAKERLKALSKEQFEPSKSILPGTGAMGSFDGRVNYGSFDDNRRGKYSDKTAWAKNHISEMKQARLDVEIAERRYRAERSDYRGYKGLDKNKKDPRFEVSEDYMHPFPFPPYSPEPMAKLPWDDIWSKYDDPIGIRKNFGISADDQKERDKLTKTTQGIKDQVEAYKKLEAGKVKHLEIGKFMIEAERVYGADAEGSKEAIEAYTKSFEQLSRAKVREKNREEIREKQIKGAEGVAKTFEAMRLEAEMIGRVGDAWHRSNQYAQLHADALDAAAGNALKYKIYIEQAEELHKRIRMAEKWAAVSDAMESSMATAFEKMTQEGFKFGEAMKSIAYDVMKAFARAMVIEPMAEAGAGLFRSFLTNAATSGIMGIGGGYTSSASNQAAQQTNTMSSGYGIKHNGGMASKYGGIRRSGINPSVFNNAPKLHDGLKNDEFPAILQTGEDVIPRGGSAGGGVSVTINNNGTPQRVTDQQTSMENGKMMLSLWVEDFMNEGDTFDAVAGSKGLR